MIGVDTNLLVRYLTQDDAQQSLTVNALFSKTAAQNEPLFIDDVVLCELVWVLRAAHGYDRSMIAAVIEKTLNTSAFAFASRDLIRQAVSDYRDGKGGFADYLIGHRNLDAGCRHTATFDRSLSGSTLFAVL